MTHIASASFRDPDNAAVHADGTWLRVASPASADALDHLISSPAYAPLVDAGAILPFQQASAEQEAAALSAYTAATGRQAADGSRAYAVASIESITYPWEWPNSLLRAAAMLTLDIRLALLDVGLDLKDASAMNIQFTGVRPALIDIGSVERWRPNPSWNAARQFIEHFINPLAVGSGKRVTAADAWTLGQHRGITSQVARELMPARLRRRPSLFLLQASTRPVERNAPAETAFGAQAAHDRDLALRATRGLTRRLRAHASSLGGGDHATTWHDYGPRTHYESQDLERKASMARAFIQARAGRERLVLDVGGNDGFTGADLARQVGARVIVLDSDAGALDVLHRGVSGDLADRITPILGDITNLSPACGLLDAEFAAFTSRVRPSALICQAVLHHVVITQGTPMPLAIEALARFGAPLQVEFADEDDPKVQVLIRQIPSWRGTYALAELMRCLQGRFANVEQVGRTSPTRVVVNAWND
ncbi:MAG: class I SAM-dependent methyltransferase [Actinomycetales bacterium]|nr:class I SAM-dependent methyltransferase [Actinomycetales bacterium]